MVGCFCLGIVIGFGWVILGSVVVFVLGVDVLG